MIENRAQPMEMGEGFVGAYWCSIEDSGYRYSPFPCTIRQIDGRLVLAKLGGSQRFKGEIKPRGQGFSFAGVFYCPWGDCTQQLHGVFRPSGNGRLRGTFRDASFIVELAPTSQAAFGGTGYGGDTYGEIGYGGGYGGYGYGGSGYGGLGYGGAGYGGAVRKIDWRRVRRPLPSP